MRWSHILHLGVKELWSLLRDPIMLILIIYSFSLSIYTVATAIPQTLQRATISVVDEDQSPLSMRIIDAFYLPYFLPPEPITHAQMDVRMDAGLDTFALDIPPDFQRDVLDGKSPVVQLNVDATRVSQAFIGAGYVQSIVVGQVVEFVERYRQPRTIPVQLALRARFNPELNQSWFGAITQVIDNVTMLSIILTGAALIRERERGTIEHLLVMPITPFEIMASKVWSMALVVLIACGFAMHVVVQLVLEIPIQGSLPLFLGATALHLFATTSMGILLGTVARSMPQFGLLLILTIVPLQMLSGGGTPRESMPEWVRNVMLAAPNTHFVMLAQAVLFRGAGLSMVWPQLLAIVALGSIFFGLALSVFRRSISTTS